LNKIDSKVDWVKEMVMWSGTTCS